MTASVHRWLDWSAKPLFRKAAWASQRKRPCSGAGPCMALASLAGFAGADQALTSPELVVQKNYSFCRGLEKRLVDPIHLIVAIKSKALSSLAASSRMMLHRSGEGIYQKISLR